MIKKSIAILVLFPLFIGELVRFLVGFIIENTIGKAINWATKILHGEK